MEFGDIVGDIFCGFLPKLSEFYFILAFEVTVLQVKCYFSFEGLHKAVMVPVYGGHVTHPFGKIRVYVY